MISREHLEQISRSMNLTSYQLYILEMNIDKYDFHRLIKHGDFLYAPYKIHFSRNFKDAIKEIIFGRRADLIGPDRLLVFNKRGIKMRSDGSYR